jgi:tRNA-(ms[2]io[6]A)-hydroxylase
VLPCLDEVLLDHAHCEKKAAGTALGLLFRYPDHPALLVPLTRLAREELAHFEEVLAHLQRRGGAFRKQLPSPYAPRLLAAVRKAEPLRRLDTLLCCALIEARSCERLGLLARALEPVDAELAALYHGLLASEARHFDSYVDLARATTPVAETELRGRLAELAAHEHEVLRTSPPEPRLHNGA